MAWGGRLCSWRIASRHRGFVMRNVWRRAEAHSAVARHREAIITKKPAKCWKVKSSSKVWCIKKNYSIKCVSTGEPVSEIIIYASKPGCATVIRSRWPAGVSWRRWREVKFRNERASFVMRYQAIASSAPMHRNEILQSENAPVRVWAALLDISIRAVARNNSLHFEQKKSYYFMQGRQCALYIGPSKYSRGRE